MYIIVIMCSKIEIVQVEENGCKKVVKFGMKLEQCDGVEYEFIIVLDIVYEIYYVIVSKDCIKFFFNLDFVIFSEEIGKQFFNWLELGVNFYEEMFKLFVDMVGNV